MHNNNVTDGSDIKIAVAKGDGIGPEIMDAVLQIFSAAKVPLNYLFIEMGKWVFDKGFPTGMTPESKEIIEQTGVLFKGPMETPKGEGVKSINVTARKTWNTYANKRSFKSLRGVETVYSKAGLPIDLIVVRENIEDTYGGIEHQLTSDVALVRRFITKPGSLQLARYAFEMAKTEGRKRVTCGHKANIMKITDGLFLSCFYEVAKNYPDIHADDIIVDDLCMKLVVKPNTFDIIMLPNLQGDIVSDLCAGLVGGLGFAPSANIGDHICIFEAVHGTAPDIAGKNLANPTALLLSGIGMLNHLSMKNSIFKEKARIIEDALLLTLEQGKHTGDFGSTETPSISTKDFAKAITDNLVMSDNHLSNNASFLPKESTQFSNRNKLTTNPFITGPIIETGSIVGADIFIESLQQPSEIANKLKYINDKFFSFSKKMALIMISNRGTQVWPTGSVYTNLVNHFRLRFESKSPDHLTQSDIIELYREVSEHYRVSSVEILQTWNGKKGYSLAQGQE
ncbi:MAG TPA: isocitrate/isopropylmalate family dehydrogenase [Oligoflexia bacterium]|nr:isocitrate/isopropylmalate family dehydrogenase [Oligoflexia bacterium]HMP48004.1 isocitrate/isopropylmalate family dehydrogenase [Oligoflexia bacterium]